MLKRPLQKNTERDESIKELLPGSRSLSVTVSIEDRGKAEPHRGAVPQAPARWKSVRSL